MTEEYPLIYGSIIKIKTINQKYDNQLFFIRYINKSKISLISNNNLENLTLEINDDDSYSHHLHGFQLVCHHKHYTKHPDGTLPHSFSNQQISKV